MIFRYIRMNEAEKLAAKINKLLPDIKSGTLRFWGYWSGRPGDNSNSIVRCESDSNLLKLHFDEGETLSIWDPSDFKISASEFYIKNASRVRFEWFSAGKLKVEDNLYFKEYVKVADKISGSNNYNLDTTFSSAAMEFSAVEIL